MKTLLIDFDGVIHSYTSGWIQHNIIPDPPVKGAFKFLDEASRYFKVAIYSARSKDTFGIVAMKEWFEKYGMPPEVLAKLTFPEQKPPAFLTIDDRCLCFHGDWPSMNRLMNFTTWMETPAGFRPTRAELISLNEELEKYRGGRNQELTAALRKAQLAILWAADEL